MAEEYCSQIATDWRQWRKASNDTIILALRMYSRSRSKTDTVNFIHKMLYRKSLEESRGMAVWGKCFFPPEDVCKKSLNWTNLPIFRLKLAINWTYLPIFRSNLPIFRLKYWKIWKKINFTNIWVKSAIIHISVRTKRVLKWLWHENFITYC